MNNRAYLQVLTLPVVMMSPALSASNNPDLRYLIDSASRSVRSRQFDRAINDLIPALRVAKCERTSNETVSALLSNLRASCAIDKSLRPAGAAPSSRLGAHATYR